MLKEVRIAGELVQQRGGYDTNGNISCMVDENGVETQLAYYPDDRRKREGELMSPGLFPAAEIATLKDKLDNDYSAQYQQKPLPRGGGLRTLV